MWILSYPRQCCLISSFCRACSMKVGCILLKLLLYIYWDHVISMSYFIYVKTHIHIYIWHTIIISLKGSQFDHDGLFWFILKFIWKHFIKYFSEYVNLERLIYNFSCCWFLFWYQDKLGFTKRLEVFLSFSILLNNLRSICVSLSLMLTPSRLLFLSIWGI